jgi:hypothetical protein
MEYAAGKYPAMVKDYTIIKPDSLGPGHYLTDENNGLLLDLVLMGNSFYSIFSVAGQTLSYTLKHNGDHIFLEIFVVDDNSGRDTKTEGAENETVFEVTSYAPFNSQYARLYRNKN